MPVCRQSETQVLPDILVRYVRTGKVKLVAHPLAFIGPTDSIRGRNAMIAAAAQNRAFNFAELLYFNQGTENTGWLNKEMVVKAATSVPGLHVHQLLDARKSAAISGLAAHYEALGTADKVTGTPTFIVRPSLGGGMTTTLVSPSEQQLAAALDS